MMIGIGIPISHRSSPLPMFQSSANGDWRVSGKRGACGKVPAGSSRQEGRAAADRVEEPFDWSAVERLELLAVEYVTYRTFRNALAVAQQIGAVGGAQGVIRIVRGEQHAVAGSGERANLAHHLSLVAE